MSTTLADLQRWMGAARESEHLEFKEAKNQYDTTKLMKYCVAIGNEGGGQVTRSMSPFGPRDRLQDHLTTKPRKPTVSL